MQMHFFKKILKVIKFLFFTLFFLFFIVFLVSIIYDYILSFSIKRDREEIKKYIEGEKIKDEENSWIEYEKAGRVINHENYLILDKFVKGSNFYELSKIESIINESDEIYNLILEGNKKNKGWFNYRLKEEIFIEKIPDHFNQRKVFTFLIAKYKFYLIKKDFGNAITWLKECVKYTKNIMMGNRFPIGALISYILVNQLVEDGIKPLIESDIRDTLLIKSLYIELQQLVENLKPPHIYLKEEFLVHALAFKIIFFPFIFSNRKFFEALKFYLKNKFILYNFLFSLNTYCYKEIRDFKNLFLDTEKLDSLFRNSLDLYSQVMKERLDYVNKKAKKSILSIPDFSFLVDRILNIYLKFQIFINKFRIQKIIEIRYRNLL